MFISFTTTEPVLLKAKLMHKDQSVVCIGKLLLYFWKATNGLSFFYQFHSKQGFYFQGNILPGIEIKREKINRLVIHSALKGLKIVHKSNLLTSDVLK